MTAAVVWAEPRASHWHGARKENKRGCQPHLPKRLSLSWETIPLPSSSGRLQRCWHPPSSLALLLAMLFVYFVCRSRRFTGPRPCGEWRTPCTRPLYRSPTYSCHRPHSSPAATFSTLRAKLGRLVCSGPEFGNANPMESNPVKISLQGPVEMTAFSRPHCPTQPLRGGPIACVTYITRRARRVRSERLPRRAQHSIPA